jgi:hypothetical protein
MKISFQIFGKNLDHTRTRNNVFYNYYYLHRLKIDIIEYHCIRMLIITKLLLSAVYLYEKKKKKKKKLEKEHVVRFIIIMPQILDL